MRLIRQEIVEPENPDLCSLRRQIFHLVAHIPEVTPLLHMTELLEACYRCYQWPLPPLRAKDTLRWDLPPVPFHEP
jgi:hypothetical protein